MSTKEEPMKSLTRYLDPNFLNPLKYVNVKAGNNYTISVEYVGSPDCYVDGSPLVSDERTTVSAITPITTFHIANIHPQKVPCLLEGNRYEFQVFAVIAQGRGFSTNSDEAMPQAQLDVSEKPGRLFAIDADKNFIKIDWKPPTNNGGSQITGYDVERCDLLGERWITITSKPVSGTDYKDTQIEDGHQYEHKVRAYNAASEIKSRLLGKFLKMMAAVISLATSLTGCHVPDIQQNVNTLQEA